MNHAYGGRQTAKRRLEKEQAAEAAEERSEKSRQFRNHHIKRLDAALLKGGEALSDLLVWSARLVRIAGEGGKPFMSEVQERRVRMQCLSVANYYRVLGLHYPEVELALSALNNAELHRALITREIDIAVARPELKDEEFRQQLLCREKLILALPDSSPLVAEDNITFADLSGQTFVLYPRRPRPSYADVVLDICEREGVKPGGLELTQDFQSAISLVSVGVGLSVVPESVSRTTRPGVCYRPYVGHNPGTALTVHSRLDNRAPQVLNFMEITRKFTRTAQAAVTRAE